MICVFRFALSQQCWGNCPGFVFKAKISESITDSGIKQCLFKLFALLCRAYSRGLLNEKTKSMLSPGEWCVGVVTNKMVHQY